MRGRLARRRVGEEEGFSWRGEDASRLEGFSDGVFAFAVTLLVVSLDVPGTFDELLADMRGFFAFAVCFALLFAVWLEQYKFFRRYGLGDRVTVSLNAALLFIVLFYVYPLKFLFTLIVDQALGFGIEVTSTTGDSVPAITQEQWPLLMVIYGAGFIAIHLVFVLLYLRAYASRAILELDANEMSITRQEIQGFSLMVGIGLLSIAIAVFGGTDTVSWAGAAYLLIFPLQSVNTRLMKARRKRNKIPASDEPGQEEEDVSQSSEASTRRRNHDKEPEQRCP